MSKSEIIIAFIIFFFLFGGHFIDLRDPLTREVDSNVKYGRVTEATISNETGIMEVSVNFEIIGIRCNLGMSDIPFSKKHLGTDALKDGLQIMEVAERHPEVKIVRVLITTDEPSIPKIVSLETHTQSGIDWKNETISEDLEAYSKERFDKVVWYINTLNQQ